VIFRVLRRDLVLAQQPTFLVPESNEKSWAVPGPLKPLNIVEAAEAEYLEALAWYRDRDPRVAARFAAETGQALELVET
jgi:hypothetical protein